MQGCLGWRHALVGGYEEARVVWLNVHMYDWGGFPGGPL